MLSLTLAAPAMAGSSTDAAVALGAFAVFNQLFGGFAAERTVVVPQSPAIVYAPPPVVYVPPPVYVPAPPPPPAYYYYVSAPPVGYAYPYGYSAYRWRYYHGDDD